MVFRYYGDRHADVQQFEPLVDRRAGGIADTSSSRRCGSGTGAPAPLTGSIDLLREQLAAGAPLVLLLEDRPGRYHYVVAVGADADGVLVHDPTWGPWRRHRPPGLQRRWAAARNWMLLIQPAERRPCRGSQAAPAAASTPALSLRQDEMRPAARACGRRDRPIRAVRGRRNPRPRDARVPAIAQRRWRSWRPFDSRRSDGTMHKPSRSRRSRSMASNTYAWDVLGSARFIRDDAAGALSAWNQGRQADARLGRDRWAVANTLLAGRRVRRPDAEYHPHRARVSARRAAAARAARISSPSASITRRTSTDSRPCVSPSRNAPAGRTGSPWALARRSGEKCARPCPDGRGKARSGPARWRWWSNRPRVGLDFTAPRVGVVRGVSKASGAWERETYAVGEVTRTARRLRDRRLARSRSQV